MVHESFGVVGNDGRQGTSVLPAVVLVRAQRSVAEIPMAAPTLGPAQSASQLCVTPFAALSTVAFGSVTTDSQLCFGPVSAVELSSTRSERSSGVGTLEDGEARPNFFPARGGVWVAPRAIRPQPFNAAAVVRSRGLCHAAR